MNKEQFRQQGIEIRKDFPLFNSADVVYLDNAATSQKPECVIQAERDFPQHSSRFDLNEKTLWSGVAVMTQFAFDWQDA